MESCPTILDKNHANSFYGYFKEHISTCVALGSLVRLVRKLSRKSIHSLLAFRKSSASAFECQSEVRKSQHSPKH